MNINPEQLYTYKSLFSVRRVQTTSERYKTKMEKLVGENIRWSRYEEVVKIIFRK